MEVQVPRPVLFGALAFAVAGCASAAHLARQHLLAPGPADVRRYTIRILLLPPVYAVGSWLALAAGAVEFNGVLALLRKGCESLVVLAFVELLLSWLGGAEALALELDPGRCRHLPPLSFVLPQWAPAPVFVQRTLAGVLQNLALSAVLVPFVVGCWWYGGAPGRLCHAMRLPLLVLMSASQFLAVYCVVTFYHASRDALAPLRPVQKLISIKGLVFVLFWQEALLHVAEHAGAFHRFEADGWSPAQVAGAALNATICVEMLVLSLLHAWLYPPGEVSRLRELVAVADLACLPHSPHRRPQSPESLLAGGGAAAELGDWSAEMEDRTASSSSDVWRPMPLALSAAASAGGSSVKEAPQSPKPTFPPADDCCGGSAGGSPSARASPARSRSASASGSGAPSPEKPPKELGGESAGNAAVLWKRFLAVFSPADVLDFARNLRELSSLCEPGGSMDQRRLREMELGVVDSERRTAGATVRNRSAPSPATFCSSLSGGSAASTGLACPVGTPSCATSGSVASTGSGLRGFPRMMVV
eukprot:TRINITY_DN25714_c0_g2_i1.p1 TRINITY_DN25714_c0_g2~~TRINITY_DN25714_c0_g2_i1.p1  ORF type:complete len:532 (-),score=114.94 TRINITY_DN25714_c0_g2_i1:39-1634(-)